MKEMLSKKKNSPIHNVYPSRWHSVSKLMNIVLVVVGADDVILVRVTNQFNDDDDDGNRRDFLRTFIRLFICNICSLLSLFISRLCVKYAVSSTSTATFESIFLIRVLLQIHTHLFDPLWEPKGETKHKKRPYQNQKNTFTVRRLRLRIIVTSQNAVISTRTCLPEMIGIALSHKIRWFFFYISYNLLCFYYNELYFLVSRSASFTHKHHMT